MTGVTTIAPHTPPPTHAAALQAASGLSAPLASVAGTVVAHRAIAIGIPVQNHAAPAALQPAMAGDDADDIEAPDDPPAEDAANIDELLEWVDAEYAGRVNPRSMAICFGTQVVVGLAGLGVSAWQYAEHRNTANGAQEAIYGITASVGLLACGVVGLACALSVARH